MLSEKAIDDYNLFIIFFLFSENTKTNAKYKIEDGDPFYKSHCLMSCYFEDDEQFNMNWSESDISDYNFCYIMHDILYHSQLNFEDIISTDCIWIDFKVDFQLQIQL